jgi:hypothetical protein
MTNKTKRSSRRKTALGAGHGGESRQHGGCHRRSVGTRAGIRTRSDQSVMSGTLLPVVRASPSHQKVVHPCGSQRGSQPITFRSVGVGTSSRAVRCGLCAVPYSRVVRTVRALSSGLAAVLATVAGEATALRRCERAAMIYQHEA